MNIRILSLAQADITWWQATERALGADPAEAALPQTEEMMELASASWCSVFWINASKDECAT